MYKRYTALLLAVTVPLLASASDQEFDEEGTVNIECTCKVASSGAEIFKGDWTPPWVVRIHVHPGLKVNLDQICYRKRDVEGGGACATGDDEAHSLRFYKGKVQGT